MIDHTHQIANHYIPYPTSYLCYLAYNNKISIDGNAPYTYTNPYDRSNPTVTTIMPNVNNSNYEEYSFAHTDSVEAIEQALKTLKFKYDPKENEWSLRIALNKLKWCKENFLQLGLRDPSCRIL